MDIADQRSHRALAYVAAVTDNGHRLTRGEANAYFANHELVKPTVQPGTAGISGMMLELVALSRGSLLGGGLGFTSTPGETPLKHLCRLAWLEDQNGTVSITSLGRAVLRSLENSELRPEAGLNVVLDGPIAFPLILGLIADAGPGALVDTYFQVEQLPAILQSTEIDRVLTKPSRPGQTGRIVALEQALGLMTLPRPFEIRCSDEIHDRFFIPKAGPVRAIGSSLNHIGVRFSTSTVISDEAVISAIRATFDEMWSRATPVAAPSAAPARTSRRSAAKTPPKSAKRPTTRKRPA